MSTLVKHMAITNKKPTYHHYLLSNCSKLLCREISSGVAAAGRHRRWTNCCTLQLNAERRSGNYKPPLWDFDYIQSLKNEYTEDESYMARASELNMQVKKLLDEETQPIRQLELIDDLQRLGISYHFHGEIRQILSRIYSEHKYCNIINNEKKESRDDLYSAALAFRLLRQHGFKVSQEVFDCFKNEEGEFKASLCNDAKGLLQLYEASFLLTQGERRLEMAMEFSANILEKNKLDHDDGMDEHLSEQVSHALELPLHWRIQRPYAKWSINSYQTRPDMKPVVLQLAKLDFNVVQATHLAELQHLLRWWKQTRLAEKLPFARDRLVECYLITIGLFEPQYVNSRIIGTKVNALVTVIDDMFDVYGTMQELLLFNDIIQRWDIEGIDTLPNYMQMCFLALYNFINETAYDILSDQGFQIIPYLRKAWADLCTSYIQEAKWYSEGYKPRLEEYISNAWISISVPVMLSHAFFALANPIEKGAVDSLYEYHDIVKYSGMIARLANDLATSPDEMQRGDVPKSVQCYMNESGADIEEARRFAKFLVSDTWKKINGELGAADCIFPESFMRCAVEFGRIAHYVYGDGDGHGVQRSSVKDRISSLLFEPIV